MDSLNSQFKNFHIFEKFKALLSFHWNIDVFLVDLAQKGGAEDRLYFSEKAEAGNNVVQALLASKIFKERFFQSLSKGGRLKQKFSVPWKQAGLDIFSVPLLAEDSLKGFVAATGVLKSNGAAKTEEALRYLRFSEEWIKRETQKLKKPGQAETNYIKNFLSILAEESFSLILERQKQKRTIRQMKLSQAFSSYEGIVGKSSPMQFLYNILEKIRKYDSSILIEGESGTGRELLARTIHAQSPRSGKPFLIQNCSVFNDSLLEKEVFGYKRGAVNGASEDKKGLLEAAHQGVVFFDEIGSAPMAFQAKLSAFLQNGAFSPSGSSEQKKADVRIIAATGKDLKKMMAGGLFCEELFYSLNIINLRVPPLRRRAEDIPLLANHFLKQKDSIQGRRFSPKALEYLRKYGWPGNIRELESEVERILELLDESQSLITESCLSLKIRETERVSFFPSLKLEKQNLKETLQSIEKQILLECLKKTNWNKTRAAKMLGSSRTSIILKTKEYGIQKESEGV